ncbi:IclR family transcriptional regulator [Halobaculum magnesiiphilum]|uniref:IclR family transcriptional regulator n=1 Tax=Halobaculum magnesiiphilum TaxID=1017351 RepID=A0A8T8WIU8_9EURY|nr:IclR family transcriptional regulator [Halobaculum magnesiiphilum]QZP39758.1 IclR family transcriptional regulator [Halobaculum magnesiiphilum]
MARNDSLVKSLGTGFEIVAAIEDMEDAGITDISRETGIAKSTVHDHLKTMVENKYVIKRGNTYELSLKFLTHGGRKRDEMDLYQVARPEIRDLANETGELVNLVTEEHGLGVYLDLKRGDNAVNLDSYLGKREYLHSTAVGKTILAHRPEEFVDDVVKNYGLPAETSNTVATREELDNRLETIRSRGYAIDQEERLPGLCCVAAPITDGSDYALGSISISGPKSRMQEDRLNTELADRVSQVANVVEVNLAYS